MIAKKILALLLIITFLACFLRMYKLGEFPVGFHRDEAFLGYNAYSIFKTGKDINGNILPLHIESFLYSPAGYVYFSIPIIALLDLSAFSVRFASALFGSMTVVLSFFLARQLFQKYKYKDYLGIVTAFFLTISPWHINLSRTSTENVLVVFFISFGTLLYLLWRNNEKKLFLILFFLSFGITVFMYQAPRAFLPFFIPLLFIFLPKTKLSKNEIISSIVLFLLIVVIPLIFILSSPSLSLRIKTVSIFDSHETQLVLNQQLLEDGLDNITGFVPRIFHNKILGYGFLFIQNYFKHLSYDFLFTDQVNPQRYRVPLIGLMYIFELPLLIIGIWKILRMYKRIGLFLIGWILITFIGVALTFDDIPNMQRTLMVFPALSLLVAFGFVELVLVLKHSFLRKTFFIASAVIVLFFVSFYLHQYYIHAPKYQPWHRNSGYKDLVQSVNQLGGNYEKIVITNRESAPTIFFLFYNRYDPIEFQKETKDSKLRDFDRVSFGSYTFTEKQCPSTISEEMVGISAMGEKKILYVDSGLCEKSSSVVVLDEVNRPDNSNVFRLVERQGVAQ